MPVINVPQPAFMEEEEIAIFADANANSGAKPGQQACSASVSRPNMAATAAISGMIWW